MVLPELVAGLIRSFQQIGTVEGDTQTLIRNLQKLSEASGHPLTASDDPQWAMRIDHALPLKVKRELVLKKVLGPEFIGGRPEIVVK